MSLPFRDQPASDLYSDRCTCLLWQMEESRTADVTQRSSNLIRQRELEKVNVPIGTCILQWQHCNSLGACGLNTGNGGLLRPPKDQTDFPFQRIHFFEKRLNIGSERRWANLCSMLPQKAVCTRDDLNVNVVNMLARLHIVGERFTSPE